MTPPNEPASLKPDEEPDEPASREIVRSPVTATVIGGISGTISAFFGIGSGLVMAPALALLLRSRPARATGTSLALVLPIAAAALARYQVLVHAGAPAAPGFAGSLRSPWDGGGPGAGVAPVLHYAVVLLFAFGSVVGASLVRVRAAGDLRYFFGTLLMTLGLALGLNPFPAPAVGVYGLTGSGTTAVLAVGVVSGAITAYLSAGGGVIIVPLLVLALGFPEHLAQATSLGVILVVTVFGALAHILRGNVIWSLVPWLAFGGILAGWEAMGWALLLPDSLLRAAFGALLAVIGIGMILSRARRQRARSNEG